MLSFRYILLSGTSLTPVIPTGNGLVWGAGNYLIWDTGNTLTWG
jgi:hypothetical protein